MSEDAFGLAAVLVGYPLLGCLAYACLRHGSTLRRRALAVLSSSALLCLPLCLPSGAAVPRFFVALLSVLWFARFWETAEGRAASAESLRSPGRFALFLGSVGDLEFSRDASERSAARQSGAGRLLRAAVKGGFLLALLALATAQRAYLGPGLALTAWCLWSAYLASTALCDVLTGVFMVSTGQRSSEVFQAPIIARSPIEFWSQRWNLMFRNSAYRLLFVPVGGRKRPLLGSAIVFTASALLHEYLVVAALGHSGGHMAAFFALQGLATQLNAWARKRAETRLSRPLGIALTWGWMLLTGPLFFAPILEIFPLDSLALW